MAKKIFTPTPDVLAGSGKRPVISTPDVLAGGDFGGRPAIEPGAVRRQLLARRRTGGGRGARRTDGTRTTAVILFGRYTTLAGDHTFTTSALNVTAYDKAELTLWRGNPVGDGTATFNLYLERSVDRNVWKVISQFSPAAGSEVTAEADLTEPWFRARVVIDRDAAITTWLVGQLINRKQS